MAASFTTAPKTASTPTVHPLEVELPAITKFKIALCQLSVSSDKNQNISKACNAIKVAAEHGAQLVLLPEMWNCPYSADYFDKFAENFEEECPSFSMLSKAASCNGITVVGGSVPERDNHRLYNTCCIFGPDGKLMAKHRKIHLFDIEMEGDICLKESHTFAAGHGLTIVPTKIGSIGVGICHDIRFPELAMLYRSKGVNLICYPGAFNMSTGEMLWELVQRARAADNQLFVATCSPSRDSAGSYEIWGHSTVVGPLGEIIATCGPQETTVMAEIDYAAIHFQREKMPVEQHKREDIYLLKGISQQ